MRGFVANLDHYASKFVYGIDISSERHLQTQHAKKDGGGKNRGVNAREGSLDDRVVVPGDWLSIFPPKMLLWVPESLQEAYLHAFHDQMGHRGRATCWGAQPWGGALRKWPGMDRPCHVRARRLAL